MFYKKVLLVLVLVFVVGAFTAVSFDSTFAAGSPEKTNHPPECFELDNLVGGQWGIGCYDQDKNISSVSLKTNAKHTLYWDKESVLMLVELEEKTEINWHVCDAAGACVGGSYQ